MLSGRNVYTCRCHTGRRFLRFAPHGDLIMPWARTSTYGQRSFAVSGLSAWNDLPPTLRASSTTLRL